jgi:activator of HSP90 ATPase
LPQKRRIVPITIDHEDKTVAESITVSALLSAKPKVVYEAWLDGKKHSDFTGSRAEIDGRVGGAFTAWDGYISGTTISAQPFGRIVQTWRTTEFPADAPDSEIEVILEEVPEGTRITIVHTNIPDGQGEGYRQGWVGFYFTPMEEYFSKRAK